MCAVKPATDVDSIDDDSDDEEELKDTSVLSFEDLGAFAKSLHDNGADPASTGDDEDAGGSEGPLR